MGVPRIEGYIPSPFLFGKGASRLMIVTIFREKILSHFGFDFSHQGNHI